MPRPFAVRAALVAFACLPILTACGDAVPTITLTNASVASAAVGTWKRSASVIGSSLVFTLERGAGSDTTLAGTGTYAIEAGRSGTLTVRGAALEGRVHLDLAFDYGEEAHADVALDAGAATMTGGIKYGPASGMQPTQQVTFARVR